MMLRFASALDELGQALRAEVQRQPLLNTAFF